MQACHRQCLPIAAYSRKDWQSTAIQLTDCANIGNYVRILANTSETKRMDLETERVGQRIREEIARRRISRQELAELAKISISSLEKALAGARPFTLATIIRIEDALDTRIRSIDKAQPAPLPQLAPEHMGAYSKSAVKWLEGRYLAIRPSFNTPNDIFTYLIDIAWADEAGHLDFAELKRDGAMFEQTGHVSLPNLSGHIYLVTNESGQHRLMILSRPTVDGSLYGTLSTLKVGHGSQLVPACCAIALVRYDSLEKPVVGLIAKDTTRHGTYRDILKSVAEMEYASFF
jgi:transcriptional regulator with XRE-family HTH domain